MQSSEEFSIKLDKALLKSLNSPKIKKIVKKYVHLVSIEKDFEKFKGQRSQKEILDSKVRSFKRDLHHEIVSDLSNIVRKDIDSNSKVLNEMEHNAFFGKYSLWGGVQNIPSSTKKIEGFNHYFLSKKESKGNWKVPSKFNEWRGLLSLPGETELFNYNENLASSGKFNNSEGASIRRSIVNSCKYIMKYLNIVGDLLKAGKSLRTDPAEQNYPPEIQSLDELESFTSLNLDRDSILDQVNMVEMYSPSSKFLKLVEGTKKLNERAAFSEEFMKIFEKNAYRKSLRESISSISHALKKSYFRDVEIKTSIDSKIDSILPAGLDDIKACVFPPGKHSEACVAYALDDNIKTISLRLDAPSEHPINLGQNAPRGKGILVKANCNGKKVLIVDGALISKFSELFLMPQRLPENSLMDRLEWSNFLIYSIAKYAQRQNISSILINANHYPAKGQQCVHEFVWDVATIFYHDSQHYLADDPGTGIREFVLGAKLIDDDPRCPGFGYTHWVEKEPMNSDSIKALSSGKRFSEYNGEQYLEAWYGCNKWFAENYDSLSGDVKKEPWVVKRHEKYLKFIDKKKELNNDLGIRIENLGEEIVRLEYRKRKYPSPNSSNFSCDLERKKKAYAQLTKKYNDSLREYRDYQWNNGCGPITAIELKTEDIVNRLSWLEVRET